MGERGGSRGQPLQAAANGPIEFKRATSLPNGEGKRGITHRCRPSAPPCQSQGSPSSMTPTPEVTTGRIGNPGAGRPRLGAPLAEIVEYAWVSAIGGAVPCAWAGASGGPPGSAELARKGRGPARSRSLTVRHGAGAKPPSLLDRSTDAVRIRAVKPLVAQRPSAPHRHGSHVGRAGPARRSGPSRRRDAPTAPSMALHRRSVRPMRYNYTARARMDCPRPRSLSRPTASMR
jgi:hypothetical protein